LDGWDNLPAVSPGTVGVTVGVNSRRQEEPVVNY